jgi:hypothetical protein
MQSPSSGLGGATAPYTFVPTGLTVAVSSQAIVNVSPSGVSSDAQGQQVLQSSVQWAQSNGGSASSVTVGGHPAVLWWDHEGPPQPGCAMCPGDPGPDLVKIGLTVYLGNDPAFGGLTVVDVLGSARIDAVPANIFCDMEEMVLGVTFSM